MPFPRPLSRRRLLLHGWPLLLSPWVAGLARAGEGALQLYGLTLKDLDVQSFIRAAQAAGNRPVAAPGPAADAWRFDARGAGVPALLALRLKAHEGRVAVVRFTVKGYGQDNVELRRLLLAKYGVPTTVSPRPLSYAAFAERMAPRGGFQWRFGGGMRLVYEHPRIGEVSLSYIDDARMQALAAGDAAPSASAPLMQRL